MRGISTKIVLCFIYLALGGLSVPSGAFAAHGTGPLININTATVEILDTLDGIGPALAQRIIDYRTENGPFISIEDISNVSGIGGPGTASYEKIKDHITVEAPAEKQDTSSTNDSGTTQSSKGGYSTTHQYQTVVIQPPEDVFIRTTEHVNTVARATTHFSIESFNAIGKATKTGKVHWVFGDGGEAYGRDVSHVFYYPGTYTVVVTLTDDSLNAEASVTVKVRELSAQLVVAESGEWLEVVNESEHELDISEWRLIVGGNYFSLPLNTRVAAGAAVRFPSVTTKLHAHKALLDARLVYPNGKLALIGTREQPKVAMEALPADAPPVRLTEPVHVAAAVVPTVATRIPIPAVVAANSEKNAASDSEVPASTNEVVRLTEPPSATDTMLWWYVALATVLSISIAGVLLFTKATPVVDGYEIIEGTKDYN